MGLCSAHRAPEPARGAGEGEGLALAPPQAGPGLGGGALLRTQASCYLRPWSFVTEVPVPSLLAWASGWEQRTQTHSARKPAGFCPPQFSLLLKDLFLPKFSVQ